MTGDEEDIEHGLRYYPYRRSGKADPHWKDKLFYESPRSEYWKITCEENIMKAFQTNPVIKILVGALEKAGCPISLKRNLICEYCDATVQGGFDVKYNQILVCKNVGRARSSPESVIISGLIHMYDQCVNKYDHKNLDHFACTEIRSANLTRCSFIGSCSMRQSSPINIKKTHQDCVRYMAISSVLASRKVDIKAVVSSVMRVFDRCYNDLEPLGRRFRPNSDEGYLAEEEARCLLNIGT